jgi:hypothetical protein
MASLDDMILKAKKVVAALAKIDADDGQSGGFVIHWVTPTLDGMDGKGPRD